jgi:nitroreductase
MNKAELLDQTIFQRCSYVDIGPEAPSDSDIEKILHSGMSANDHGNLKPWEFRVFSGNARAKLGQYFKQHEELNAGTLKQIDKADTLPLRAPVIICISSKLRECNIPAHEQIASGASACQLITLAADMLGYACIWRTGKYATSSSVKQQLGIEQQDQILGFIYLGSIVEPKQVKRDYYADKVITYSH